MKKHLLLIFCMLLSLASYANDETPAITLTIEVDKENTSNNEREFTFAATESGHRLRIDWGNGTLVETEEIEVADDYGTVTTVSGRVLGDGTVKIYGDGIAEFCCDSHVKSDAQFYAHVTSLDVTNAKDLIELTCNTNSLTSLDLSQNAALEELNCNNNAFGTLDLSANPALRILDASNTQLTSIDLSKNAALTKLTLSNNPDLTSVDFSGATALASLFMLNCGLTTVDLSQNAEINFINVNNNKLTALDVTANEKMATLFCVGNQISDLKVNKIKTRLFCNNNNLTLATLPALPEGGIKVSNYTYAPQNDQVIPENITTGEMIDLSAQASAIGVEAETQATVFIWKGKAGATLVAGTDYTEDNGIFTFLTAQDSVYCEMTSAAFPTFTGASVLKTTAMNVVSPAIILTIEVDKDNVENNLRELDFAVSEADHKLLIDWGDGTLIETEKIAVADGWTTTTVSGSVLGEGLVKICGDGIVEFDCSSHVKSEEQFHAHVTSLDVTNAVDLTKLTCNTNSIAALDLSKNTKLTTLECSNNLLKVLDVSNNKELVSLTAKQLDLTGIDLSANTKLTTLYLNENKGLTGIDLKTNVLLKNAYLPDCALTEIDVTENSALATLSVNNNKLTALDVTANEKMATLFCVGNQISDLKVNKIKTRLFCNNNNLTLATLPALPEGGIKVSNYTYAPQNDQVIPENITTGEMIDLSAQASAIGVEAETQATVFIWKGKAGATLVAGTDYTEDNGIFTFLTAQDSVYCEMTSAAFPKFTGANVFKTTAMDVSFATGIDAVDAAANVSVCNGQIIVCDANETTIYSVSGQLVAAGKGNGAYKVEPGIYIVVTDSAVSKINVQ